MMELMIIMKLSAESIKMFIKWCTNVRISGHNPATVMGPKKPSGSFKEDHNYKITVISRECYQFKRLHKLQQH